MFDEVIEDCSERDGANSGVHRVAALLEHPVQVLQRLVLPLSAERKRERAADRRVARKAYEYLNNRPFSQSILRQIEHAMCDSRSPLLMLALERRSPTALMGSRYGGACIIV